MEKNISVIVLLAAGISVLVARSFGYVSEIFTTVALGLLIVAGLVLNFVFTRKENTGGRR
ncbi:hypothetical protein [Brevibacterium gallinarum]|uniref:Uncharacterized protein n=1 Tax=Brevibacterium gallinarum TaxID=2762220 RepID=A0ABR8WV78_9MICO|nr:hypothetical protein [Brevibacterium gallinarum]MBD8020984.1 hypothetical protein [Brevibacterium gallinarum]